jgi:hypothetical protein
MIILAPGGGVGRDFRCKAAPPPGSDVRLLLPLALLFRHLVRWLLSFAFGRFWGTPSICEKMRVHTPQIRIVGSLKCYGTIPNTLTSYMRALLAEPVEA